MERKNAYQERMEAQLRIWKAQIDELRARADKVKAEARIEYQKQMESLQSSYEIAARNLKVLKDASEDVWSDFKSGVENAWTELKKGLDNAASKFK